MSAPVPFKQSQPSLGRGKVGEITAEHVDRCNAWLQPLADRDGFSQLASVTATDIRNLLDLGRTPNSQFSGDIRSANGVRTMLLVDMGNVVKTIRWGAAPQEDEPTADIRFRLTARGRRMLQQCCKDLWDQMPYGKP